MTEFTVKNTGDWPSDIQTAIDFLARMDGDNKSISADDIEAAKAYYSKLPPKTSAEQRLLDMISRPDSGTSMSNSLRSLFNMRYGLSGDNPVHRLINVETELMGNKATPDLLDRIYRPIDDLLKDVKGRITPSMNDIEKAQLIYRAISDGGFSLREECIPGMFVIDINRRSLDCDSSSFLFAAIAYELKLPFELVTLPSHVFVRWNDGKNKFNIDYGHITNDELYREVAGITDIEKRKYPFDKADFMFYFNRGTAMVDMSNACEAALDDYKTSIKLNPGVPFADVYVNRGACEVKLGKIEEAVDDLKKALKLNPRSETANNTMGVVSAMKGRINEAIGYFDRAIELRNDYPDAYANRGKAYLLSGEYEAAIDDLNKALSLEPNYLPARKDLEAAKKELQKRNNRSGWGCSPRF